MAVKVTERKEIDGLFEIYFSCMTSRFYFIEALRGFVENQGYGREYVCCSLAATYESWEDGYFGDTGAKISIDYPAIDEDTFAIVTNNEFLQYLTYESYKFISKHPEMGDEINVYLNLIRERLSM